MIKYMVGALWTLSLLGGAMASEQINTTEAAIPNSVSSRGFHQTVLGMETTAFNDSRQSMRVLSFTVDPGGQLSEHKHTGPGFICVTTGEIVNTLASTTAITKPGQCIFDSGDVHHALKNATKSLVSGYTFEVVPAASTTQHQSEIQSSIVPVR